MAVLNDQDLELLELSLDGELSPAEEDDLRARLDAEPELVEALGSLRRQRELRQSLFAALEPAENDPAVRRLITEVRRQTTREVLWGERLKKLRWVSGLAACLLLSFLGGYALRGGTPAPGNTAGFGGIGVGSLSPGTPIVSNEPSARPGQINFPGINVRDWNTVRNPNTGQPSYDVCLTDQAGNVIGVQRFKTLEAAMEFKADVERLQRQHQQLRDSGPRLVADQF